MAMTTDIVLVDDHQLFRQGLKALLATEPGLRVVGEAADAAAAMALVEERAPGFVILDVGLEDISGISLARQISKAFPNVRIVGLSMHVDTRIVGQMLQAGAMAYVLKYSAFEDLIEAIRQVQMNRMYLSPGITRAVVDDYKRLLDSGAPLRSSVLTSREREVAELLAMGRSTAQVAEILRISTKTVATHRKNLMDRLNLKSIAELTQFAIKEGLVVLEP